MIKFREAPSIGGWLAITNCVAWVILMALLNSYHDSFPEWMYIPMVISMLLFSLPVALPFLLPDMDHYHGPTYTEQVMVAIVIGVNSFLWGYGIEFLLRKTRCLFRPRQPLIPPTD